MSARRPTVVLAAVAGRYPVGGVMWCALHYAAGLQALGYDVVYLEDTGEANYDPDADGLAVEPDYAVAYLRRELARVGLQDRFCYVDHRGGHHGLDEPALRAAAEGAVALVNLSGGCWFDRPAIAGVPRIFVDTDPGFTQQGIADAEPGGWYLDWLAGHVAHFTFAQAVGRPGCDLAPTPFTWRPTVQPVHLPFWTATAPPPAGPFTTVMSWSIDSFGDMGEGKAAELLDLIDLPRDAGQPIRLAVAGQPPLDLLREHGWDLADAVAVSRDTESYRAFIAASRAELGFAKAMYVRTRGGWVSDRTQCYLASGRPALVRDTGLEGLLPLGEGLLTFDDRASLLTGMEAIAADPARHGRAARALCEEHFDGRRVIASLLERAGVR